MQGSADNQVFTWADSLPKYYNYKLIGVFLP